YAQAAISAEIRHLNSSTQGERNTTLNKAAFRIGQFVRTGLYTRSDAESELLRTAMSIGLTVDEALRTIKSGLDNGEKKAGGSEYNFNATPPYFLRTKEISDTGGNPQKTTNFSPG